LPIKTTSSLRKDERSRDFYKGEYVKCILMGEEKERMGIVFEKEHLTDTVTVWLEDTGEFVVLPVKRVRKL
jgi:hypothetical protein